MIKRYKEITIPYWFGRQLEFTFYHIYSKKSFNHEFRMTIWKYHKLKDIPGYENEWGSNWWKHITIYKKPKRSFKYNFTSWLGILLIDIDDWFAKRKIYFNWFAENKEDHVNFLCKWAFDLLFDSYECKEEEFEKDK